MKLQAFLGSVIAALLAVSMATPASARDTAYHLKIADVKADARYAGSVSSGVTFYFGDQKPAVAGTTIEEGYVANLKTNSVGKSDEDACRWVMLSALKEMGEQAI